MKTGPKYKVCRRLGPGVYDKCQTQRYALSEERKSKNTQKRRRRAPSGYHAQLLEKQKVRLMYGVSEKQFKRYVKEALLHKDIAPTDALLRSLESRLDNIVYRAGLAATRRHARQLVSHGHFIVNNKKSKIPSLVVRDADTVAIREGSKEKTVFKKEEKAPDTQTPIPSWIVRDKNNSVQITGTPTNADSVFDLPAVIEFYSR